MNFNNQWVEIFKAADYGDKGNWTEAAIAKVVANFDAKTWQPVLTPPQAQIGHRDDVPSLGLVAALKQDGRSLFAQFEKVHPALEQSARDGRFPNRSAGFYVDPNGKGPMLRHVAFLGAMPPEVKGLQAIKFSDGDFVAIDFNEEDDVDQNEVKKTVAAEIKAFLSSMFGEKQPAAQFTEEQVQERITASTKPLLDAVNDLTRKFTESQTATVAERTALLAASGKAKAVALVAKLKAANQWVPAFTEAGMESTLENLAVSGAMVKFGEPGKEKEISAFDSMAAFLEGQSKIVPIGESGIRDGHGKIVSFHRGTNPSSVQLANFAEELCQKDKTLDYGEALKQARAAHPELAQPAIAVGQV